jgi:hypothetical protein
VLSDALIKGFPYSTDYLVFEVMRRRRDESGSKQQLGNYPKKSFEMVARAETIAKVRCAAGVKMI